MDDDYDYEKPWRCQRFRSASSQERVRVTDPLLDVRTARHVGRVRICFAFLAAARPGDGALLNSDMGGSDPFDYKMIEVLTQRALATGGCSSNVTQL